jgi:MFS family permease
MYDFMVSGYYATAIGGAFFPVGNEFASLMLALMTFGVGFLMRPFGAIVLGAYADKHGRRAGLEWALILMSIGTVLIAFMPGYASIGLVAPLLVLTGRLLQGFSVGMSLGGVSVYLAEIATPGRKGFYVSSSRVARSFRSASAFADRSKRRANFWPSAGIRRWRTCCAHSRHMRDSLPSAPCW